MVVDIAFAVVAGVLLALVAFRRARQVRTPDARRAATRSARGARARDAAVTVGAYVRAGVGVAALVGIVWLAVELFA